VCAGHRADGGDAGGGDEREAHHRAAVDVGVHANPVRPDVETARILTTRGTPRLARGQTACGTRDRVAHDAAAPAECARHALAGSDAPIRKTPDLDLAQRRGFARWLE
jgi:hypothetical protein